MDANRLMNWETIKKTTQEALESSGLSYEYKKRLLLEFKEIEKQATQEYWEEALRQGKKFSSNKNGLVLPWILGLVDIDPIQGERAVYAGPGELEIDGIEIELEDGRKIPSSVNTMILTKRGLLSVGELQSGDEIV